MSDARDRSTPAWLLTEDYEEIEVGRLKAGKEAEVFVVERVRGEHSCLLAHKRYRPKRARRKGELEALGFEGSTTFANDAVYRQGERFARSRDQRAAARKTEYGKSLLVARWPGNEFEMLERLWTAGARVPYPVARTVDGILMEYVGDRSGAAPRLAQARLDRTEVEDAMTQLVDNLRMFVAAGVVHADLSAFNVLWWQDRLWFIDLPQAVDLAVNASGFDLLHRDVCNVVAWFARQGVVRDPDALFADLLAYVS